MIGFSVGLLQFSLLSRSSRRSVLRTAQAIQQCGSTESNWLGPDLESREFYDNLWNTAYWQGMKEHDYVTYCRPWTSCGFHDRGITLQAEFLSTSTALELKLFNYILFYRTKFVFLSPFYSHSLLDRLNYFLLISQVMLLADVAHQMYRAHHYLSGILSCALIIALSMWAWNSRDRAAFKDNLQASFLVVCCSTLSCDSGCKSVASRASFLEELSKHWSCSGS